MSFYKDVLYTQLMDQAQERSIDVTLEPNYKGVNNSHKEWLNERPANQTASVENVGDGNRKGHKYFESDLQSGTVTNLIVDPDTLSMCTKISPQEVLYTGIVLKYVWFIIS